MMVPLVRTRRTGALWLAALAIAALVVVGCGGGRQAAPPGGDADADVVWKVTASEFSFRTEPEKLTAKVGQKVKAILDNKGAVEHDFTVHNLKVDVISGGHSDPNLPPVYVHAAGGKTAEMVFIPKERGTYKVTCAVPGHEQLGMVMEVTIE